MPTDPAPILEFEDYLKSNDLAFLYNLNVHRTSIVRTTGILSTIASTSIIVHILRSHHGLSTTYHRLLLGLSIGDIIYSFFGFVLGNIMVPKEYDYIVPGAIGNQATCDAQGFFFILGSGIGFSYNMSICIYYLAIVTFNKKDDYIRTKLEPWLHGLSILLSFIRTSGVLAIDGFNSTGGSCWFVPNDRLPHCWNIDSGEIRDGFTIPCGRGDGKENPTLRRVFVVFVFGFTLATPFVIMATMALMYRSVQKVEKKMQKYGVGALRLRNKARNTSVVSNGRNATSESGPQPHDGTFEENKQSIQWLKIFFRNIPCINAWNRDQSLRSKSNTVVSQKRVILYRATGYVLAWAVSWTLFLIISLIINSVVVPPIMIYFLVIFNPLQGVFNLISYLHPKIKSAKKGHRRKTRGSRTGETNGEKRSGNEISWFKAFVKAYMSRGPKRRGGPQQARFDTNSRTGLFRAKTFPLAVWKEITSSVYAFSERRTRSLGMCRNADMAVMKGPQQVVRPVPTPGELEGNILGSDTSHNNGNEESQRRSLSIQTSPKETGSPLVLTNKDKVYGLKDQEDEQGDDSFSSPPTF